MSCQFYTLSSLPLGMEPRCPMNRTLGETQFCLDIFWKSLLSQPGVEAQYLSPTACGDGAVPATVSLILKTFLAF